jgi:ubiquitin C-terminal hydrolase
MFSHYVESFEQEFAGDRTKELFVLAKGSDELPLGHADVLIAMSEGESIRIKVSRELQKQTKWRALNIDSDSFKSAQTSIYECLEAFTQQEDLDEENKWYCTRCKQHQLAKRQLKLRQLPSILLIHFKRFKKTGAGFNKLDDVIEFPFEGLQVSEYTSAPASPQNQARYNLFAIIAHRGTMFKGHYVAFVYSGSNKSWIKFDDDVYSNVKPDIAGELNSFQPYILFYRKEPAQ